MYVSRRLEWYGEKSIILFAGNCILTDIKQKASGRKGKATAMKTIEELYNEINASLELKKAVSEIRDKEALADFLKKHDCDASVKNFTEYAKSQEEGEIEDDDVKAIAGGYHQSLLRPIIKMPV